jgi:hypothetical protein
MQQAVAAELKVPRPDQLVRGVLVQVSRQVALAQRAAVLLAQAWQTRVAVVVVQDLTTASHQTELQAQDLLV